MHRHVGISPIMLAQQLLYLRGFVVSLVERDVAIHQDVEFDGVVIADATGTKVVGLHHSWQRSHQTQDLVFDRIGKRLFRQVAYAIAQQVERYLDDKGTHDDGGNGQCSVRL